MDPYLPGFKYSMAALSASLLTNLLHPFDVIKIRFQSHDGKDRNLVPKYKGILNAFSEIYKKEGIRGLYKGMIASVIGQSLARVIFFTVYEIRKEKHSKDYGRKSDWAIMRASFESGVFSVVSTQPIWIIKTRLQLNLDRKQTGIKKVKTLMTEIYAQHGIKGFYRGMSLSLVLSSHGVFQLTIYEKLMNLWEKNIFHSTVSPLIFGMISKLSASIILYPITTVRTRIQQNQFFAIDNLENINKEKYKNISDVIRKMIKYEGAFGFYKGFIANALRSVPSKGIYFYFYEQLKDYFFGGNHRDIRGT